MKIAVISDTHIHKHGNRIVEILDKYFKDADMIIHAGDYTDIGVLKTLMKYKKFIGVYGNNDKGEIRNILKEKEIIRIEGYSIGICHGHGEGKTTLERAFDNFKDDKVDIIIFGHSHEPSITTKNKILVLNPGTFTGRLKEKWHSFIILQINQDKIDMELKLF